MAEKTQEELLKQIQELTDVVRDHKNDPATIDMDVLVGAMREQVKEMYEAQVAENLKKAPAYRVPGDAVGPEGSDAPVNKSNRYFGIVKDFQARGYSYDGFNQIRPIDLWLASRVLRGQVLAAQKGYIDRTQPVGPSDDLQLALKALTAGGAGTGAELVPTDLAAELWRDLFLASRIVAEIPRAPMPTNPFEWPLGLGNVTWRKGAEVTATTPSDTATDKIILTATELITEQNWSYTLNEDAILAIAPAIRERLSISAAEIIDSFALNADKTNTATGNINLDDADPPDDSYYLSDGQDGLRHQWLVDNSTQGVDATGIYLADDVVVAMLTKMGKYAANSDATRMISDVTTYLNGFLRLDEVVTVEKFGPSAVVHTGQIATYRAVPIILSESAPLTEADGKCSTNSSNNTLGQITCYNRLMWKAGFVREVLIEVDRDIQKRQYIMVTSLREAVAAHGTRASATHTAGIFNIGWAAS